MLQNTAFEPMPEHYKNALSRCVAATRPQFLSITLSACMLGFAIAKWHGIAWQGDTALLVLYFCLLVHAGCNVLNDYHDAVADQDNDGRIYPFTGGSRFIQNGVLTRRQTLCLALTIFIAALPAGLYLGWLYGHMLLLFGIAGVLSGLAYSVPPVSLVSRGFGEVSIFVSWLLVVVVADYTQRGVFSHWTLWLGAPFALLVVNILLINQFPDRQADAAAKKRTLVVRLGAEQTKWIYLFIVCLAYGWLVMLIGKNMLPSLAAAAGFAVALSLQAARSLIKHAARPKKLVPAIRQTILAAHLYAWLLAAVLFWLSSRQPV